MKRLQNTTAASLVALSATLFLPGLAEAGCIPSVESDQGENVCVGSGTLSNNVGNNNTALGDGALGENAGGTGNTASGAGALLFNTGGNYNTANGDGALINNITGSFNTAVGLSALFNSTGTNNTALGAYAGDNLTSGSNNIAIGNSGVAGESATIRLGASGTQTRTFIAGISGVSLSGGQTVVVNSSGQLGVAPAVSGTNNTANGVNAMSSNTVGAHNTANGFSVLRANTTGGQNTAAGARALVANTTGSRNTASGVNALSGNTTGGNNVALGFEAAKAQSTGSENTAVGYQAGLNWTTGRNNIALGAGAGRNQTGGSNNISIGAPGWKVDTATIRIGKSNTHTAAYIAGISNATVTGGMAVMVKPNGQLGVVTSSRRYKQDIQPMGDASSALMQLQPVTFHYKQADENGQRPLQYGLIAEDVAEVMPALAIFNDAGQPESVAYQMLPSLLLNEYQKQNRELLQTKQKLAAMEAEMAAMKLMMSKLASGQSGGVQFASTP